MFCKNCGAQLPDGSEFCTNCGAKLNGNGGQPEAPQAAKEPKKPAFKLEVPSESVRFAALTVLFVLLFVPTISTVSLLTFPSGVNALFIIAEVILALAVLVYIAYAVITIMKINLSALVKKILPLGFLAIVAFSHFFAVIGCIAVRGLTMSLSWYLIAIVYVIVLAIHLLPLINKSEK